MKLPYKVRSRIAALVLVLGCVAYVLSASNSLLAGLEVPRACIFCTFLLVAADVAQRAFDDLMESWEAMHKKPSRSGSTQKSEDEFSLYQKDE